MNLIKKIIINYKNQKQNQIIPNYSNINTIFQILNIPIYFSPSHPTQLPLTTFTISIQNSKKFLLYNFTFISKFPFIIQTTINL